MQIVFNMQIVSNGDNCMACQVLFLKKNKKNIIDFSSAVFAYIAVKVRNLIKPVQILSQPVAFLFQVLSTSWPNSGQVW